MNHTLLIIAILAMLSPIYILRKYAYYRSVGIKVRGVVTKKIGDAWNRNSATRVWVEFTTLEGVKYEAESKPVMSAEHMKLFVGDIVTVAYLKNNFEKFQIMKFNVQLAYSIIIFLAGIMVMELPFV